MVRLKWRSEDDYNYKQDQNVTDKYELGVGQVEIATGIVDADHHQWEYCSAKVESCCHDAVAK